jgi:hypothetical protein
MRFLFDLYVLSYRMTRAASQNVDQEVGVAGIAFLTLLMMAAAGFYGWFLIALCRESKRGGRGFLVRLEPRPRNDSEALQDDPEELIRKIA